MQKLSNSVWMGEKKKYFFSNRNKRNEIPGKKMSLFQEYRKNKKVVFFEKKLSTFPEIF
jgi:hypothetical protein